MSRILDWQQKAAALDALSEISLKTRGPNDWFVSQNIEIKDGNILKGCFGNGATPEQAVEDHWAKAVANLQPNESLVISAGDPERRRAVRWNGFMWQDVPK